MNQKDNHTVFDLLDWLQDALERDTPMSDVREELMYRVPWVNDRFERKTANVRLRALDCYSA